ncbi:unnamed protein product, partial [Phaeothamnion confervicola]
ALANEIKQEYRTNAAAAKMEFVEDFNGMAAPGSSGRDLEDILMEKNLRFYDPKFVGTRERCYLVGLEARGDRYHASRRPLSSSGGSSSGSRRIDDDFFGDDNDSGSVGVNARGDGGGGGGREAEDDAWDEEEQERLAQGRQQAREDRFSLEESLGELSELAGTAGLEVVGSTYQRVLEPNPRTYIGTGKVKEIRRAMRALDCKTVILDEELSPGQQRSLETEFGGEEAGIKVLDRTALILDIFAQHARTREGQLQASERVELALNTYRLPRLTKLWTHLERQSTRGGKGGGAGLRGPGERQLEVDRRLLKTKIAQLQRELGGVRRHRDLHRRRRGALGLPVVALVGYTNSGKSTLLNALTRAGVLAEDMLFATLDPTTRRVKLPGLKVHPEVMVTDTVGFIQKLPTTLVAAFRATLEEVMEADIIVHVCDASSPSWRKQSASVLRVLGEIDEAAGGGVLDKPLVTLWNKLDLLPEADQEQLQIEAAAGHLLTAAGSARTGAGLDDLVATLEDALATLLYPVEAVVPYDQGALLSRVHLLGACDTEEFTEQGTLLRGRVPAELVNRLEPFFTEDFRRRRRQQQQQSRQGVRRKGAAGAASAEGAAGAASAGGAEGLEREDAP